MKARFAFQSPRFWKKTGQMLYPSFLRYSEMFTLSELHASLLWHDSCSCRFHWPAWLATCPQCKTVLDRPQTKPDPISPSESVVLCQEDEIYLDQQCRSRYLSKLGFLNTSAGPQADQLPAAMNWCSKSCKICSKQVYILHSYQTCFTVGWHLSQNPPNVPHTQGFDLILTG